MAEPGNADAAAEPPPGHVRANGIHNPNNLVAWNEGQFRVGKLAIDNMEIGPADRTGLDPDPQFSGGRNWIRALGKLQGLARLLQDHRLHARPFRIHDQTTPSSRLPGKRVWIIRLHDPKYKRTRCSLAVARCDEPRVVMAYRDTIPPHALQGPHCKGDNMQDALSITFRHLDSSEAIENQVRQRFDDLEKIFPRIVSCDVVIEAPQKRMVSGREFKVHLKVSIPGPDINVTSEVQQGVASEDVNLAIHDAFDTAGRLLIERKQRMAGR